MNRELDNMQVLPSFTELLTSIPPNEIENWLTTPKRFSKSSIKISEKTIVTTASTPPTSFNLFHSKNRLYASILENNRPAGFSYASITSLPLPPSSDYSENICNNGLTSSPQPGPSVISNRITDDPTYITKLNSTPPPAVTHNSAGGSTSSTFYFSNGSPQLLNSALSQNSFFPHPQLDQLQLQLQLQVRLQLQPQTHSHQDFTSHQHITHHQHQHHHQHHQHHQHQYDNNYNNNYQLTQNLTTARISPPYVLGFPIRSPSTSSIVTDSNKAIYLTDRKVSKRTEIAKKKKHTCKRCSKTFTTSGHLARHIRIHTGERKHECPWPTCSAKFSRQDNCMQHYGTHTKNKEKKNNK